MLNKYLLLICSVALVAAKGNAQGITPLFIRSIHDAASSRSAKPDTGSSLKECPMPVHRPDTSRLEQMRVARPSPAVTYSMPRVELKCRNPLDRAK
jgi:hypothetical protein